MSTSLRFAGERSDRVIMELMKVDGAEVRKVLERSKTGEWHFVGPDDASGRRSGAIVYVKEGFDEPPVVVAKEFGTQRSRVLWDPNPQLKEIALGKETIYHWKDAAGRVWSGGLYWPAGYVAGRRYPLVVQTHGFYRRVFRASGVYPTAFAARELAASGMFVAQVPLCLILVSAKEAPCQVAVFQGAVKQLAADGLVDPDRVGIIGFSRTVYHVLEALEGRAVRFAAASVTDGVDVGLWQYLLTLDDFQKNFIASDYDHVIGVKPFGIGLRVWLDRSPGFNMQKLDTPLMVVALGRYGLMEMWQPYAELRYLHRPVDLQLLNDDPYQHVLTNPAVRMASQGGTVDWFRFWLQGYEDPNPAKAREYSRWQGLCEMQRRENPERPAFCVSANRTKTRSDGDMNGAGGVK